MGNKSKDSSRTIICWQDQLLCDDEISLITSDPTWTWKILFLKKPSTTPNLMKKRWRSFGPTSPGRRQASQRFGKVKVTVQNGHTGRLGVIQASKQVPSDKRWGWTLGGVGTRYRLHLRQTVQHRRFPAIPPQLACLDQLEQRLPCQVSRANGCVKEWLCPS